jgi:hypothetical protein
MPPRVKPKWMTGLDSEQIDYLLSLDRTTTLCKGRNRHRFPVLLPGKNGEPPEGVDVRIVGGVVQVTETCEICGRTVRRLADSRGVVDYSASPYYAGGQDGYLATGLDIPRRTYTLKMAEDQAEMLTDWLKLLQKRAKAAAAKQAGS